MLHAAVVLLAYLLGSIPSGFLLVRLFVGGDVRETGSGGTGATNVTRRAGKGVGVLTLLLDLLKGAAAVLGHVFPAWLKFRGGKGVATGLGVFLVLAPLATLCAIFLFVIVVWLWRYVSLGSMLAASILPLAVWALGTSGVSDRAPRPLLVLSILGAALIVLMHRANVGRLLRGEESKLQ
jgi:glycerol-3-phosphate acyltransferase PlsY